MTIVMHENTNYRSTDLVGKLSIPTIVSKQGSRNVYQLNLMFRQITSLFDHMPKKSAKQETTSSEADLKVLRNRFVRPDKVEELVDYVMENRDTYILPPISAVTETVFSFHPYNQAEIIEIMGEQYDLVKHPHLITEVLDRFDGMLQGMLIVKESEFNIKIMDGNHRCAAIHDLISKGEEYKNLRIGVQVFYENDLDRQRQAFVDLNTSTPIDKTLLTLFGNRDVLSVAAKETLGDNPRYLIEEFDPDSPQYIGFDPMNDSVTKTSTSVLTLNIVKNMLIKFALGDGGTAKKFQKQFQPNTPEYDELLHDFSRYLKAVFHYVAPFDKIKQMGIQRVPRLREEYVSLTGAGLYLLANIGYLARLNEQDVEDVAFKLSKLEWKREVDTPTGKEYNSLFRSGVLNESGNVSNNRSAHLSTLKTLARTLDLSLKPQE